MLMKIDQVLLSQCSANRQFSWFPNRTIRCIRWETLYHARKLRPVLNIIDWSRTLAFIAHCVRVQFVVFTLQALVGAMIDAVIDDFGVLEYSTTSAGAVLGTLALLSTSGDALGTVSQVTSIDFYSLPHSMFV